MGALHFSILDSVLNRLAKLPDSEHEQAIVKFFMGFAWLSYILWLDQKITVPTGSIITAYLYMAIAVLLFCWIIANPVVHPFRRFLGILSDAYIITAAMLYGGHIAAPLFGAYLFMTFGHGFRYGNKYLFASALASILSFSLLLIYSDYWQGQKQSGYAIMLTLFVLPIYAYALIKKLHLATSNAKVASQAKSQFLANMSHEIRTPLNAIIGMNELLSKTSLNKTQKEFVDIIRLSGDSMMSLVNDIIDISKVEANKMQIDVSDFDLHCLVNSSISILMKDAFKKGLSISVNIDTNIPFLLRGDPKHLRGILLNLIGNAIKFTEQGKIMIRVSLIDISTNHAKIRFSVEDTGIGINNKSKAHIFEAFTQSDRSIARTYGGAGLGTAISKALVELMGGHINFASEAGKGSKFWFELEFVRRQTISEENTVMDDIKNILILIVNSSTNQNSLTVRNYLDLFQIKYHCTENIYSTLNRLANHTYHVVIVDDQHLDTDPALLVKQSISLTNQIIPPSFILLCKSMPENAEEIYGSGYYDIIESGINRRNFFRSLHAAVAGKFSLPAMEIAEQKTYKVAERTAKYEQPADKGKAVKIIVAEDNVINQKVIKESLKMGGHNVTIVNNGEEVLDALEKEKFDLIILDMHMPVMDGLETTKLIRFMHSRAKQPIIMLSADVTIESIKKCHSAGVDIHLTKPINLEKLLETISSLVEDEIKPPPRSVPKLKLVNTQNQHDNKIIKHQVLKNLAVMANNNNFIKDLIKCYIEDTGKNITVARNCLEYQQYKKLSQLCHAINGSSSSIGAMRAAEVAYDICNLIRAGKYLELSDMLKNLEVAYQNTNNEFRAFLEAEFGETYIKKV